MGLFLGNSMPIRDVDALAGVSKVFRSHDSKSDFSDETSVVFGPGAPTAANRGASGIDGVLSAAAGYAAGLGRPVTLLVGDVSFQHDANGLLLLRERPGQPPVTVVVVNNGGGGIFNFLPVSEQIDAGEVHEALRDTAGRLETGLVRGAPRRARAPEHAGGA
jgi:isochorismate synthase/2-succinyl-5-enolpyruvyl-6-hydroxy-3-cyclohexene-1-carboxylate synthase/2-succinyl-6-hydroxy-2,4-cyclohexadiene-1-carboxylate synthase/O-succinylbenzoate synthase